MDMSFYKEVAALAKQGKCQGDCMSHVGDVRVCHTANADKDWGLFSYCDEAIETDRQRGFTVTEDPPPPPEQNK